jgi:hypothetical protein
MELASKKSNEPMIITYGKTPIEIISWLEYENYHQSKTK